MFPHINLRVNIAYFQAGMPATESTMTEQLIKSSMDFKGFRMCFRIKGKHERTAASSLLRRNNIQSPFDKNQVTFFFLFIPGVGRHSKHFLHASEPTKSGT